MQKQLQNASDFLPDGAAFEYKENAEPTTARGVANNGSYASPISSASILSIAQDDTDVKFSMREPVERSGSLIAVDDLNEYNLDRALRLGGFPKPSIAVARRNVGHQNFGDISLVFA